MLGVRCDHIERPGSGSRRDVAARTWLVASLGFAVAALALRLWVEPLDHGYTRYATIAFEMVRSGDWIAPHLDGRLYVDKPPLAIWLIALSMALANTTASFTQHAPNVAALLLSVLFLRRLGARLFGRTDAGWLAAGLYVSTQLPSALLRDKRIDPLFSAFLLGAFDFFHAALTAHAPSRARLGNWLGAGVFLAAATLTKGPLALVFFVAVALADAAWTGRLRALATRDVLAAAALWLALVALWPLAMLHDVGWAAWGQRFSERDLVTRFAGPLHYIANLPLRLAPWTLVLPALALALRPLLRGAGGAALRLPMSWFGVVFVLLHVTSAKHSRYLLPAFPAASLLCLALWIEPPAGVAAVLAPRVRNLRDAALRFLLGLGVLAGVVAPFVPIWVSAARSVWSGLALGGALAAIGSIGALRRLRSDANATAVLARAVVVILVVEAGFDLLRSGDFLANDDLAAANVALAEVAAGTPTLLLQLGGDEHNAMLLATRRHFASGDSSEDARRFASASPGSLIVTRPETLAALRAEADLSVGEPVSLRLAGTQLVLASLRPNAIAPLPVAPSSAAPERIAPPP
jgi:4-amino-4-deoxy-L-arabinose transferase-like glycosyltransferase